MHYQCTNPSKSVNKERHIEVTKHVKPNNALNRSGELPEIDVDVDDKFKNTSIDKPKSKQPKAIKFSSAFDVPNFKTKFSIVSGCASARDKEKVPLRSKTYSSLQSSNKQNKLLSSSSVKNEPNKVIKYRDTKMSLLDKKNVENSAESKKHLNFPVNKYSSYVSSTSYSSFSSSSASCKNQADEPETNLEKAMFDKANQLRHVQSLTLKNKRNLEKAEVKNQLEKKMLAWNQMRKKAGDANVQPDCRVEELKREIRNARFQNLVNSDQFSNIVKRKPTVDEPTQMNVTPGRSDITELKTEIAEYRNRNFFVFNFSVNNSFNKDGSSSQNGGDNENLTSNRNSPPPMPLKCTPANKKRITDLAGSPLLNPQIENIALRNSSEEFIKVNIQEDGGLVVVPTTFQEWVATENKVASGLGTSICLCQKDFG